MPLAPELLLDLLAGQLSAARRILFITGAGLSADSGLPTYRGMGGLYEGMSTELGLPIETVLSGEMFDLKPEIVWKYLTQVESACRQAVPNAGHRVMASLQQGRDKVVILTQNIDGLHQRAGSEHVIDIHGDVHKLSCTHCGNERRVESFAQLAPLPRCTVCGGIERPAVVLFGEALDEDRLGMLLAEVERGFDMVVSVGTTGVFPYVRMPMIRAHARAWPSVDINPTPNQMTPYAGHHLAMRAAEALQALASRVT
jgi:NAD-dependent deacetylase